MKCPLLILIALIYVLYVCESKIIGMIKASMANQIRVHYYVDIRKKQIRLCVLCIHTIFICGIC